jgi:hypothetical protein
MGNDLFFTVRTPTLVVFIHRTFGKSTHPRINLQRPTWSIRKRARGNPAARIDRAMLMLGYPLGEFVQFRQPTNHFCGEIQGGLKWLIVTSDPNLDGSRAVPNRRDRIERLAV